jgi:hypothetical protein
VVGRAARRRRRPSGGGGVGRRWRQRRRQQQRRRAAAAATAAPGQVVAEAAAAATAAAEALIAARTHLRGQQRPPVGPAVAGPCGAAGPQPFACRRSWRNPVPARRPGHRRRGAGRTLLYSVY